MKKTAQSRNTSWSKMTPAVERVLEAQFPESDAECTYRLPEIRACLERLSPTKSASSNAAELMG